MFAPFSGPSHLMGAIKAILKPMCVLSLTLQSSVTVSDSDGSVCVCLLEIWKGLHRFIGRTPALLLLLSSSSTIDRVSESSNNTSTAIISPCDLNEPSRELENWNELLLCTLWILSHMYNMENHHQHGLMPLLLQHIADDGIPWPLVLPSFCSHVLNSFS